MIDKIDFVIPYVNPTDSNWLEQYRQHTKDEIDCRFRDWGVLPYVFRSIERHIPWINQLVLIVASDSQVPAWVDTTKVKVIKHSDFIPAEYLPVFNSNTIEMFLGNIKGLTQHFIYSNDDIFFLQDMKPSDFFDDKDNPIVRYLIKNKVDSSFLKIVKNTCDLIRPDFNHNTLDKDSFYKPRHFAQPMYMPIVKTVQALHEKQMLNSITRFRDADKNYNQYLYTDYEIFMGYGCLDNKGMYFSFDNHSVGELAQILLSTPEDMSMLCVNDTFVVTEDQGVIVRKLMDIAFPTPCKYEIVL